MPALYEHSLEERTALDAVLSRCGIDLEADRKDMLLDHLKLVIEKNRVLNLTRIDNFDEGLVLHIEDSLAVFPEFSSKRGSYVDVGTGGGFPGIPLAAASARNGVLIDSVKKKAYAVQEFIEALGLGEQIVSRGIRSEELAATENNFETVIFRAVSALPVILELGTPLLKDNGQLVAMKSVESSEDLDVARKAAELCGLELVSQREYAIGNDASYKRSVYVYEKTGEPKVSLPRRPGMAAKRPLA